MGFRFERLIAPNLYGRRVLLLVGFAFACSLGPAAPPSVLLITIDTARVDHLSVYGYARDTTPVLRDFATRGVRFDTAYAPSATTAPTHASLFTSLYPPTHRVLMNGNRLEDRHETLAEILGAAGWVSGAVVSSYVLDPKFNYG
ncbi:MAG: sulfatase-like hydrolase/transferase, partial [Myxococcota bacterium]